MSDPVGPRPIVVKIAPVPVRVELARFVEHMEAKLAANDHKAHWSGSTDSYLLMRLMQEVRELQKALEAFESGIGIVEECADVANFAMMIADRRLALMSADVLEER